MTQWQGIEIANPTITHPPQAEFISTADVMQAVVDSAINECGTYVEVYKLQDLANSIAEQRAVEAATVALLATVKAQREMCERLKLHARRFEENEALYAAADALEQLIGGQE